MKNYTVICVDITKIRKNKSEIKNLILFNCDISKHEEVEQLFKTINKSYFVSVLINNAMIDAIPLKKDSVNKFPTRKCGQ